MVAIGKKEKNLVLKPNATKIGAKNSPKTAKYKDTSLQAQLDRKNLFDLQKGLKVFCVHGLTSR